MGSLAPEKLTELEEHANDVRQGIIRSLVAAGSGHSARSLDMADVFTALYFHVMRHDPQRPEWPERDRLLLSCGHIAPVRYSAMAYAGISRGGAADAAQVRDAAARAPRARLAQGARDDVGPAG